MKKRTTWADVAALIVAAVVDEPIIAVIACMALASIAAAIFGGTA